MIQYLVLVGAVIQIIAYFSYIKQTLKGETKPNKVSWLLWSTAPLIGTAAAFSTGARWSVLPSFIAGFGPFLILISSFTNKNSYWKLTLFDYLCGASSALALILWAVTKQPAIAVVFAIASDFLAWIPTATKAWDHPDTERAAPFLADAFASFTGLAAIKMVNFTTYGFLAWLIVCNLVLSAIIHRRKLFLP